MVQVAVRARVHSGRTSPAGAEAWGLVAAAQRGDREAFGQLYARYAGTVAQVVRIRTGDRLLAEDVTGETFLRALRRIDSLREQGRDPGAWFTVIARNLVADHRKSARSRLEHITADVAGLADSSCRVARRASPEQVVIERETLAELGRAVGQLPADQQQCVRLRYLQGYSVARTAAVIGRSEGAVKALTHRGITRLRADLATVPGTVTGVEADPRTAEARGLSGPRSVRCRAAPSHPDPIEVEASV